MRATLRGAGGEHRAAGSKCYVIRDQGRQLAGWLRDQVAVLPGTPEDLVCGEDSSKFGLEVGSFLCAAPPGANVGAKSAVAVRYLPYYAVQGERAGCGMCVPYVLKRRDVSWGRDEARRGR